MCDADVAIQEKGANEKKAKKEMRKVKKATKSNHKNPYEPSVSVTSNHSTRNSNKAEDSGSYSNKRNLVKKNPSSNISDIKNLETRKLDHATKSGKDWQKSGVHPSWAAKHLAKSVEAPSVVPFQGKKITFDDD